MIKVKKDLTGQIFGKLTVLNQAEDIVYKNNKKVSAWLCQCECGNQKIINGVSLNSGKTKSCGCLVKEKVIQRNKQQSSDFEQKILFTQFGDLIPFERDRNYSSSVYFKCKCKCGNVKSVRSDLLQNGTITHCGCKNESWSRYIDLTGQRFGKLVALKPVKKEGYKHMSWLCQCDCGNQKIVPGDSLRRGYSNSCGCIKSKGEIAIENLLKENNINYEREYSPFKYPDTNGQARFDFYVNNKYFIEFDGEQHFQTNNSWWNTEEYVNQLRQKDNYKNIWCKQHNIPLIRIPYTHLNKLTVKDLLLETSEYIC